MNFCVDIFNNREKAVIIWGLIFLVGGLFHKNIRTSIFSVLKALSQKKFAIVLTAMFLYIGLVVLLYRKIQLWNIFLIKDTGFWVLGTAFVLLVDTARASQDEHYFEKILWDNLKLILVLEFIVNLYTFSLWVEIILMPLLFLIVAMGAVAETRKEHMPVKKVTDPILAIFGISLIIFALFNIIVDYQEFATIKNLRAFLLPPLLTLAYIPFLYFLALFIAYENLFIRLDIFLKKDKALAKLAKRKIVFLCLINLGKLNKFARENTQELMRLNNENNILNLIQQFNRKT